MVNPWGTLGPTMSVSSMKPVSTLQRTRIAFPTALWIATATTPMHALLICAVAMVFALMLLFAQMIHYVPRTLARWEPVPLRTYQKAVMIRILAQLMRAVQPRDASTHPAP